MGMLWAVNPKKRRGRRKLSAKQVAAGFGGKKHRRGKRRASAGRRRSRRTSVVVAAAPVIRRRRRGSRVARVSRRRGRRSGGMRLSSGSVMNLLKAGAVGGAGAVAVDFAMGQATRFLPASLSSPVDSAGQPQYGYFGVKAALAIALGVYGKRLPVVGKYADRMAEGALTVLAYQFMRPIAQQAGARLGFFNPAPTQRPRVGVSGVGRYVSGGVGAYSALPIRSGGASTGARAATVMNMVGRSRRG